MNLKHFHFVLDFRFTLVFRPLPLLNGRCNTTRGSLLHAAPKYVVAAQDACQNNHQDRSIEAPVAQGAVAAHKLTRRRFCIEYAVHTVLIIRIVLASIQYPLPVIIRDCKGDARDNGEDND